MARTNTDSNATTAATSRIWQRARQTAQDAKPVVAQVKPLANDTKAAAAGACSRPGPGQHPGGAHRPGAARHRRPQGRRGADLDRAAAGTGGRAARPLAQGGRGLRSARGGRRDRGRAAQPHRAGTTAEADEDEPGPAEPVQASADGAAPKPPAPPERFPQAPEHALRSAGADRLPCAPAPGNPAARHLAWWRAGRPRAVVVIIVPTTTTRSRRARP